ncbi:MAG: hypothetical protein NC548_29385 [Lachnospiraceae bacterium]|nr:hypothetical protein [Lachnospiraceae bacterium]
MDVFPSLIGELEFSFFSPADYAALRGVLNDVLANDMRAYIDNPLSNPAIVANINKHLGSTIEGLTMHFIMAENGTLELVKSLVPETLPSSNVDLDSLIEKLTFLEQNESKLMTVIPGRKRADYDAFISAINGVLDRMSLNDTTPTYPDILSRIEANSFVFYSPNEKAHNTGSQIISLRKRQWTTVLRGAQFMKRCNEENISYPERRRF